MPTGYTAIIEEKADLTFREFALRCARAMRACVMQREDPMSELPKAPEPSDFYQKEIRSSAARLHELRSMTPEAVEAMWRDDVESARRRNEVEIAKRADLSARYAAMRAQVSAWTPPTTEHRGLRTFMLEQIDICKSDCRPYLFTAAVSPDAWLSSAIESAEWDLANAAECHCEEIARCEERKRWIDALYASLETAT